MLKFDFVYIQNPKFVIPVPADVLAPRDIKPPAIELNTK